MRCVIWAAVSSKPQASAEKDSLNRQIADARKYIKSEGYSEVGEPLMICGHSRHYDMLEDAIVVMPEYKELQRLAREEAFDVLICRNIDRLGRTRTLCNQVEGYLAKHGIQIQPLDMRRNLQSREEFLRSPDRSAIWTGAIGGAKAQVEILDLKDRWRMGMERRINDGKHVGRLPLGYTTDQDGCVAVVPEEAKIVRRIFDWYVNYGMSQRAIAERLASYVSDGRTYPRVRQSVARVLSNHFYIGEVRWKRQDGQTIVTEGKHKPIIDQETFDAAQRERNRRKQDRRAPYTQWPLSGFIRCSRCESNMLIDRGGGRPKSSAFYRCRMPGCKNRVKAVLLERAIFNWLHLSGAMRQRILDKWTPLRTDRTEDETEREIKRLEAKLAQERRALDQWIQDYELGRLGPDKFYRHEARLEKSIKAINDEILRLRNAVVPINAQRIVDILQVFGTLSAEELEAWWNDQAEIARIKQMLREIGLSISIDPDKRKASVSIHPTPIEELII